MSAESSPAPRVVAPPPATPIRFGIVDLWLLLMLIGMHLGPLFYATDVHRFDTNARAVYATALCVAIVGGAAYLAHRTATELQTPSPLLRIMLTVAFEITLFIILGTIGIVVAVLVRVSGPFTAIVVIGLLSGILSHCREKFNEQPPRWFKRGLDG